MAYDETLADRIRARLNGPDVTERKMFGGLAFLVGGCMCCGVVGPDLVARLPVEEMEDALGRPGVRRMDFTGRPLRGFVCVAPQATATARRLQRWIELGRAAATAADARMSRPRPAASRPRRRGVAA
jgi:hypothetical protein